MASFNMKIAGAVGKIHSLFESTPQYFRAYLTEEKEDFSVTVQPGDLRFEQAELDREAEEEGFRFRTFTDPFLERAAIQRAFAEFLFDRDTLLIHGSAVAVDGKGYLFVARSGTGKSTHTRLWREVFGDRAVMVNDDKPFVALTKAGVAVFGSPWSGKHGLDNNIAVPLAGICLLERGSENRIFPMAAEDGLPQLLKQGYCPMDGEKEGKFHALMVELTGRVSLWRMECTKEQMAAQVAHEAMNGANDLALRPFCDGDADAVINIFMNDQVKKTYMVPDFANRQAAMPLFERLKQLSSEENRFVRGIYLGQTLVGFLNDVDISGGCIEMGYVIDPAHKGRGYATQALNAAIEALFRRGFSAVRAGAFEENAASIRVMKKCGMKLIDLEESIQYRGKTHRCVYYEIRKQEG